ncbi:MAG: carbohydrate kinase family protein [Balneolaceae bacterium]
MNDSVAEYDLLVAGELNVDLIMDRIEGKPEVGKERLARSMTLTLGSSSAIFASNISSLGSRTAFAGLTGLDSFGELVLNSLQEKKVHTEWIATREDRQTGATIAFNMDQERMMVTHPGPMEEFSIHDLPMDQLHRFRHLHISSIFLQPGLKRDLTEILSKAQSAGLTTSLDPQWDPDESWDLDLDNLLPLLDWFLPNERELQALTHTSELESAIRTVATYSCRTVVKMGTDGARAVGAGRPEQVVPAYVLPDFRDAIGAGDSFNAGLIHSILQGTSEETALRYASIAAAVSTTGSGGTTALSGPELVHSTAIKINVPIHDT